MWDKLKYDHSMPKTGWKSLDHYGQSIGRGHRGGMAIFASSPSSGKSMFQTHYAQYLQTKVRKPEYTIIDVESDV